MLRYYAYCKYVLKHKWYLFLAVKKFKLHKINRLNKVQFLWQIIMHDMSKFRPSELFPYAKTFYSENGESQYVEDDKFYEAWNYHQKRNKHHWQYWVLKNDNGIDSKLDMPINYIVEMIADWISVGKVLKDDWYNVIDWYEENVENMQVSCNTEQSINSLLIWHVQQ